MGATVEDEVGASICLRGGGNVSFGSSLSMTVIVGCGLEVSTFLGIDVPVRSFVRPGWAGGVDETTTADEGTSVAAVGAEAYLLVDAVETRFFGLAGCFGEGARASGAFFDVVLAAIETAAQVGAVITCGCFCEG